ncbi:hypothetical protein JXD38_10305 [candidate division WOR-3 bacterium]|nr:hypothetical protein [candidate division WOR-3 bacterium]
MRLKVCLCLAVVVLLASGAALSEAAKLHPAGGLLYQDPYTVPGLKVVEKLPASLLGTITAAPSALDWSSEMPPVGDQGNQNSCVAWAMGYYDKTHVEYIDQHYAGGDPTWYPDVPEHQVSPSFIYNQINAGNDAGAYMTDAQTLIIDQGAAMLSDCPYNDNDYTTWPTEAAYENALPYRGLEGWVVNVMSDVGINQIRLWMVNHNTCVLGINVYDNFDHIEQYDTVYTVHDKTGRNRGGHALCIVGYDDNKQTADGPGAFRLVNSWGPDWGDNGYCWMSYYAVKTMKARLSQGFVYILTDKLQYEPRALGRVKFTHPCRDRIGISFGAGSPSAPLAGRTFRQFWSLQGTITDWPFPDHNLVFDLSGGAWAFDETDTVFVCCVDWKRDKKKGTIDFFRVEYGNRNGSSDEVVAIPDYNVLVYDKVVLPFEPGPQGKPLGGSVAASRASYRNGAATVAFNLDRPGTVRIAFFDNMGRTVAAATAPGQSGPNELSVRLPRPAGVYFYRLESGSTTMTGKLATIR